MSKQYLKMADVFRNEMRVVGDSSNMIADDVGIIIGCYSGDKMAEYVLHAINSHDELVEQNKNMKLRINQLLSERNATGVAIEKALNGDLPEQHSMINRLQMIASVAANRDELVAENERLRNALECATNQLREFGVLVVVGGAA